MIRTKTPSTAQKTILMLLTNAYDPDPRVRQEALSLIRMGYRVRLLAWDRDRKSPPSECMEGVEVERVFLSSSHGRGSTQIFFYTLLYLRMLWRCLRTPFDAVHCHDLDTLPLGFLVGKLKGKPVVYDAHESFPDMLDGSVLQAIRRALVKLEDFLIRRTDLLITVGEKLRQFFAQRGARRSVVVGNWKRLEEFSRTEMENLATRKGLGIPPQALVVVCITQLLKDRKIEELFDAAAECPNVYVIVAGRGVLEGMVRHAAQANPRILFAGLISGKQIADYTCAGDVVYYGFDPQNPNARFSAPNKLYEALAAGRPLITGDFGEIAEVVRTAECGIVLHRYDATEIRAALIAMEDPEVRRNYTENAQRFGSSFMNWTKGEEVLFTEYSALLGWPAVTGEPAVARTITARAGAR
jgi:glycosyltransferase involved in cell wall biosynthesis